MTLEKKMIVGSTLKAKKCSREVVAEEEAGAGVGEVEEDRDRAGEPEEEGLPQPASSG